MNALSLAINLNKRGVSQMSAGNFEAAVVSFQTSFDFVLALEGRSANVLPYNFSQVWQLTSTPTACALADETGFRFFDQCFEISPCEKGGHVTQGDLALFMSTILFNTALAHMSFYGKHSKCVSFLFQKSFDVLENVDASSNQVLAVTMAISNNIASLALERKDYMVFESYRQLLGSILARCGHFFSKFFAGNFATTADAHERPAAAA